MKKLLILLLVLAGTALSAQDKPGKLRITDGFLKTTYEIGDKTTKEKDVRLHLDKYTPEAGYLFRRSMANERNANWWSLVGGVGLLGAVFSKDAGPALAWSTVAVIGTTVTLVNVVGANSKQRKARALYNRQYGYE